MGLRVSSLPTATAPGVFYTIEGGVPKKITLGTIATQAANAVAITGGSIAGLASLTVPTGNIGAGTASPATRLHGYLSGASATEILRVENPSNSGSATARHVFRLGTGGGDRGFVELAYDGLFYLSLGGGNPASQGLRIDANGITVPASLEIRVGTNRVLNARKTGWSAATGTATRTSFNTATATVVQVAERLKALIDDAISHGLIGA